MAAILGGAFRHIERGFGRFERSLRVPRGLNPDSVTAEVHDGVLMLRIAKPERLKSHRIPVREDENPQNEGAAG